MDDLIRSFSETLRPLVRAIAAQQVGESGQAKVEAAQGVHRALSEALAAGDLDGRRAMLSQALGPYTGATEVPDVPFGEAVTDILKRDPRLANSAEAVAKLYAEGPAFALARSVELAVTREVQRIVRAHIEEGATVPLSVDAVLRRAKDFTNGYAETVIRTNVATAQTEGRFAQVRDPDVAKVIRAFRYAAVRDSDVRRGRPDDHGENHLAADGLIAGVDDPIWQHVAPPCGYNCRCRIVLVTKYELERRKLLAPDGKVIRYVPAGFERFRRHPNFARSRMPGT